MKRYSQTGVNWHHHPTHSLQVTYLIHFWFPSCCFFLLRWDNLGVHWLLCFLLLEHTVNNRYALCFSYDASWESPFMTEGLSSSWVKQAVHVLHSHTTSILPSSIHRRLHCVKILHLWISWYKIISVRVLVELLDRYRQDQLPGGIPEKLALSHLYLSNKVWG